MSVFKRFTDIVNANLHSMLEKAEQPEKMISYVIQEMEEALVEVRSAAAKQLAEKKTRQRMINELEAKLLAWQHKAGLALEKGREDLAKAALLTKQALVKDNEVLLKEVADIDNNIDLIQADGQRLQAKLSEAKSRQNLLTLRADTASSRLKLCETHYTYDIESAIAKFESYERKVERLEAEVQSYDLIQSQLQPAGSASALANELEHLARDAQIDDELAALKIKLAS
ncbi:MAG: PspA/IM30 family protein [Thalassotalea sp.]